MKRFWAVLLAIFWIAISTSLAQIVSIDEKIITFDKLSKTVIPFVADKKPTVKIEPSLEGQYNLVFNDGKGTLTFAKPVPEGAYTITLASGGKTVKAIWTVLPATLSPKSRKTLTGLNLYYGKRLSLRSKLQEEAELPLQQFKIDYQCGNEKPNLNNPYSESWVGPNIPASAKKVKVSIVWIYPPTGERVPLFAKDVTPEQMPPEISCNNPVAEMKMSATTPSNGFQIAIKGISVDYEFPLDADNRDPNTSKSIKATLSDIEPLGDAEINYNSSDTQLRIYNGDAPDPTSTWMATATSFSIVQGSLDISTGQFPITIQVKDLPTPPAHQSRILKGTIAIKAGARIVNRRAGAAASSSSSCVVTINIPYQFGSTDSANVSAQAIQQKSEELRREEKPAPMLDPALRAPVLCADCPATIAKYPFWRVTSPALREEIQAYFIRVGRKLPTKPLGAEVPLIINGEVKKNGRYDLISLRFGNELITKREIAETLIQGFADILSEPIKSNGGKAYQYEPLSAKEQEKERELTYSLADKAGYYAKKATLRKLDYYRHSGYALYEADSALVHRLSERLTPGYPRSRVLDSAENECTNTDDIKKRISKRQPVPQAMIDEGGSPWDCEKVKNYYTALAGLVRIGRAYIVVNMRGAEPKIIGMVSTMAPGPTQETDPDFLNNSLQGPISNSVLDVADLQRFKTTEFEKDDSTKTLVAVKGSMLKTSAENLYDYCVDGLRKGLFTDRTASVMAFPASSEKRK